MTDTWWNENYSIRRKLTVEDPDGLSIVAGSPIYVVLPYAVFVSLSKIRSDFEDFEILYWDDALATPSWSLLSRSVVIDENADTVTIIFNTLYDIEGSDEHYYMYINNYTLVGAEVRGEYVSSEYSTRITPSDGQSLTFSRPEEDWSNGLSLRDGARAAFSFMGKSVRLAMQKGPNRGIVEFRLDEQDPVIIDTYAVETSDDEIVYTTSSLDVGDHYIRIKALGTRSISSSDTAISVGYFEYSRYIEADINNEEVNPNLTGMSAVIGP